MVIYKITFPNNKKYIGQTTGSLSTRISHHRTDAKRKRDITEFSLAGSKIGNAIRKYGLQDEWFEVIEKCKNIEDLNEREVFWIEYYKTQIEGYNIKPGGNNAGHSEETKIKIGLATKERWADPEIAERMREGLRKGTETMKKRMGEHRVPRILTKCAECGVEFESRKKENRVFCSQQCAASNASKVAAEKTREERIYRHSLMEEKIYKWARENIEIIKKCPFNKISTNLYPILDLIEVSDWRTVADILKVNGRKEILQKLKDYVKMYAEPDRK